jgi:hypothetical protein
VYVRVLVRGGEWMEEMWMWGNIVDWLHIYTYENIFHIYTYIYVYEMEWWNLFQLL